MSVFTDEEFNGLSLRECIVQKFGEDAFDLTRMYDRTCPKLARFKNHSEFNLHCTKLRVIPPSLGVSCPVRTEEGLRIADRAGHAFVRERLRCSERRRRDLEEDRKWTEIGLRRRMDNDVFERSDQLGKKNLSGFSH